MTIKLVYATENYKKDAQLYNVPLQNVTQKIISGMSSLERFEDHYYVLKKCNGYDNRIIAYKDTRILDPPVDGHTSVETYLLMRILKRGNSDYDTRFSSGNLSQRHAVAGYSSIIWDDVNKFIQQSLSKPVEDYVDNRQKLTPEEQNYIYTGIDIGSLKDHMVYESKEWVESIRQQDFIHQLGSICTTLGNFFTLDGQEERFNGELLENNVIETMVPIPQTNWWVLIYTLPEKEGWFLGNIAKKETLEIIKKESFDFMYSSSRPTRETIIQKTRRVYPYIYLAEDSEFWNDMEKDPWGNYALSGEELKILRPKGEGLRLSISFPLFVNGRAGSGKSTILQYLFTEFLISGLKERIAPSLYLSYSKELIDNAKAMVRSLIVRNVDRKKTVSEILDARYGTDPRHVIFESDGTAASENEKEKKLFDDKLVKVFRESFYSFHDLLFSLIPAKYKNRFPQNKYWNFTTFKLEYNRKFPNVKKLSAAICWHIIRTYIKGWFDDDYCDPKSFKELSEDSVSQDTFEWVYSNIWENWYKKEMNNNGIWDDQDLVRFCLNPSACYENESNDTKDLPETFIAPRFSGIFCDESQDFTQVELAAIIGLSVFSNRKITSPAELERIPFVFVGDEFQTLNPTGFSWSSLRKAFTERLIHKINPRLKGADKPFELQNNYRSSRSIVRFSNRIQLLRRILFDKETGKDIVPQKPWDMTDDTPVYCFSPLDSSVWFKLQEIKAVVIIPCEDGQSKEDYVNSNQNGSLNQFISFDENGASTGVTLLTPAQAKGMEYPVVAVYGFDNSDVVRIIDKLLEGDVVNTSDAQKIEYKYWINNVYVAITRAKKQLIILDSIFNDEIESNDNFWKYVYQTNNQTENIDYTNSFLNLLSLKERQEKWDNPDENLGHMRRGKLDRIGSANRADILDTANSLAENGHRKMDANLMSQAARIYQEIGGEDSKLHNSYGYMHLFKREYEKAYQEFKAVGKDNLAVECLWLMLGKGRPELSQWKNSPVCRILKQPDNSAVDALEKDFADLMNYKIIATSFMRKFSDAILRLSKEIKDNSRERFLSIVYNPSPWTWAINTLLSMLLENRNKFSNSWISDMHEILDHLEMLIDQNLSIDTAYLADIAYYIAEKTGDVEFYQKCVTLWETKGNKERNKNYYLSLSHLQSLEKWFDFLGDNNRWESDEALSKDLFSVLREKRNEITNFDVLSLPAKRLYTETFFKQGQEEYGFKEYAARIKNATEYEKLASTVRTDPNSVRLCHRLKTITMLESYITNWIDKPETKDPIIQATLVNNIETYFRNTPWLQPLKIMVELCNPNLVVDMDDACYRKQVKPFCDEHFSYLSKVNKTFSPLVMNVAGCVIEKCERFFSRVFFFEWAREEENKKGENVNLKSIAWFRKRRAVAKYKIAEYDGNKDEIVAATEELERFKVNPKEVDFVEYPDLSNLFTLVIKMDTHEKERMPIPVKKPSKIIRKDQEAKSSNNTPSGNSRLKIDNKNSSSSQAGIGDSSTPAKPSGADTIPVVENPQQTGNTAEPMPNQPISSNTPQQVESQKVEDASNNPASSGVLSESVTTTTESQSTGPTETNIEPGITSEKVKNDEMSDTDDVDISTSQEKPTPEQTTTSKELSEDNSNDKKPVPVELQEPVSVELQSPIPVEMEPTKSIKAKFRTLVSCSKVKITLDIIENGETVNSYSGTYNYEQGSFSSDDGLQIQKDNNRIVLPDGTKTPYQIQQKSKNEIIIDAD